MAQKVLRTVEDQTEPNAKIRWVNFSKKYWEFIGSLTNAHEDYGEDFYHELVALVGESAMKTIEEFPDKNGMKMTLQEGTIDA